MHPLAAIITQMFDLALTLTLTPRPSKPKQFISHLINYIINQTLMKFRPLVHKTSC